MSPLATYVVETLITLVGIVLLAGLVLYAARRAGVGRPTGPLELVGRLVLDGRRVVYLVRIDKKVLILGASEAGLRKLGELDADAVNLETASTTPVFREVLERALGRARKQHDEDAA